MNDSSTLLERAVDGALALAAAAPSTAFDEQQRHAYERACSLAEAALQAAGRCSGDPAAAVMGALQDLAGVAQELGGRLVQLEQQQETRHG